MMLACYIALNLLFFWVSRRGANQPSTGSDSWAKSLPISLAAANLSVSGSLLGVMGGTAYYREWFLFAPVAFGGAMALFYWLFRKREGAAPPSIAELNSLFTAKNANPPSFAALYTGAWLVFFCLLIGWEIYVASELLTTAIFGRGSVGGVAQFALAAATCGSVCIYTWFSGFGGVVKTDVWQLLMGMCVLILIGMNWSSEAAIAPIPAPAEVSAAQGLGLVFSLIVVNLFFQVPHPMNWHYARATRENGYSVAKLLIVGAGIPIAIWSVLSALTLSYPGATPYPSLIEPKNTFSAMLLLLAALGFSTSTIDSQLSAACILLRDTRRIYTPTHPAAAGDGAQRNPIVALLGLLSLALAFAMLKFVPNIFNSLLAISGSMAAFFPVLIASMKRGAIKPFPHVQGVLMFVLWVTSASTQFVLFFWFGRDDLAPWITVGTAVLSFLFVPNALRSGVEPPQNKLP